MIANKVLTVLSGLIGLITLPLQFVTTFVGGILVAITFGLLLIPLSIIWSVLFYGPLISLSWLWEKVEPVPVLPLLVAIVGVPVAILAGEYVALTPHMGEIESRTAKLRLCWLWPFTLEYMRYQRGELDDDYERWTRLQEVLALLPANVRPTS